MNHLLITGRVSDTPDRRVTPAGVPVTSFTLASNPPAPSRILYLKCVAWGDLAIQAAGLSRDMPLVVTGYLSSTKWVDKQGATHNRVELIAENIGVSSTRKPGGSHSTR